MSGRVNERFKGVLMHFIFLAEISILSLFAMLSPMPTSAIGIPLAFSKMIATRAGSQFSFSDPLQNGNIVSSHPTDQPGVRTSEFGKT